MNIQCKLLFSLLFFAALSSGLAYRVVDDPIPEIFRGEVSPKVECNPPASVGGFLCPVIPAILPSLPAIVLPFSCEGSDLKNCTYDFHVANLTAFFESILPNSNISKLFKGHMDLSNITILHLNETQVPVCKLSDGVTVGNDMRVELEADLPLLTVEILYNIDALLSNIVPVYGEGVASLSIGLDVGIDTNLRYCPTTEHLEITALNYILDLPIPFDINLEGLLGGEDFVNEIEKLIKLDILEPIRTTLLDLEHAVHVFLRAIIQDLANDLVLKNMIPCEVPLLEMFFGGCPAP